MNWKEYLTEEKKPSKSDINKIIKDYALKMYSAKENASLKIQQRFYDNYMKTLEKLSKKYKKFDMTSDRFEQQIEKLAKKFWDKKAMRGSGVDW